MPGQQVRPATQPIAGLQQDEVHTHASVHVGRLCTPEQPPHCCAETLLCLLGAQGFFYGGGLLCPSSDV